MGFGWKENKKIKEVIIELDELEGLLNEFGIPEHFEGSLKKIEVKGNLLSLKYS